MDNLKPCPFCGAEVVRYVMQDAPMEKASGVPIAAKAIRPKSKYTTAIC